VKPVFFRFPALFAAVLFALPASAQNAGPDSAVSVDTAHAASTPAAPPRLRPKFKSDFLLPLPSLLLPGFGQFFQGEVSGLLYSGVGFGGLSMYMGAGTPANLYDAIDTWEFRKTVLGGQAYMGAGLLSAYSAFRSAVPRFQQEDGKYLFLSKPESLGDMALAPLHMQFLARPSTSIPLGLLTAAAGYFVIADRLGHPNAEWLFSADDLLFAGAVSYQAGFTEEAAFRGYLLPAAYQYTGERFILANTVQSLLFGAVHYNPKANPYPVTQVVMGYYLGHMARKNQWTLSQAIFTHFWWDAILFSGLYMSLRKPAAAIHLELPVPL
jgi:Type II CAAX prenyl endopeptidase Rce1-like